MSVPFALPTIPKRLHSSLDSSEVPDIKPTDKSVLPKDTFSPTTYAVEDSLSTAVVAQRFGPLSSLIPSAYT